MAAAPPYLKLSAFRPVVLALAAAVALRGEPAAPAPSPEVTIVGYRNLWNLQGPARSARQRFQVDAVIHYYDPLWRQLWGQEGDATFYLTPPPQRLPIKAGQLVRLVGVTVPERFGAVESLAATVLDERPTVPALTVRGRLTEFAAFDERFVEIEGHVEDQTLPDANHLRLSLRNDEGRVDAVIWLDDGQPVPQYAGLAVRARGVYHAQLDAARRLQTVELAIPSTAAVVPLNEAVGAGPAAITPVAPAGVDHVVVGYKTLWNLPAGARDQPQAFRIDAVVLHYDPFWRQLWCQEGNATFFIVAPPHPLPIRSGQLVRLKGIATPSSFSTVEHLEATVLETDRAPAPLPTAGRLDDFAALNERLVSLEGYVETQTQADANHLRCGLIAEGYRVDASILLESGAAVPALAGALVRIQGVYGGRLTPAGRLQSISLTVPGPDRVTVVGHLRSDPRFQIPVTTIETLPHAAPAELLHAAGRVVAVEPGISLTLRDDTGQLEAMTPQDHGLRLGDRAEVVGLPAIVGDRWQLRQALVRPVDPAAPGRPAGVKHLLRLAHQVLALPPVHAASSQPVQLQGVVTWSAPDARFIFLQDPSGGVRVEWSDPTLATPPVGAGLSVQGNSAMGAFAPTVNATRFIYQYSMSPPEPLRLSLEEAQTGVHEARWVQLRGFLGAVRPEGSTTHLRITTATGEFEAVAPVSDQLTYAPGSFVAVRGVCTALANAQRQLTGIRLWVPAATDITVEEAAPADLFALPDNSIASLRQFGPLQGFTHWLRTGGTVAYHRPQHALILQDGADALTVYPRSSDAIPPGERVEVVGIQGRDGPRLVLRNAEVRRHGRTVPLQAVPLASPFPTEAALDSRLVRLTGTLDEVTTLGSEHFLEIRHEGGALVARLAADSAPLPRTWRRGSEVELEGIYRLTFDEHRRETGFELLLRDPADLRIVRLPPWWTPQRTLVAAAALACAVALASLWVVVLRRRVRRQTEQIRQQLDREAHLEAELERAQRVQSLGTLAGGIAHDFNNLLTVILGNISLARCDQRVEALAGDTLHEAEAGAQRARDLVQQILTFARGGEPIREVFALEPVVRETAALALSGSHVRAVVEATAGLPPVFADRAQIQRALHNLLTHAASALADGGIVGVALAEETLAAGHSGALAPGRYMRLSLTNRGETIPAERLPSIFDPYSATRDGQSGDRFGLATAYSIAQKHGGHLTVRSVAEAGTTFTLWLPVATAALAPGVSLAPSASTADATPGAPPPTTGARILFMDDEPGIRRLGETLLRHLGHEPVLVADGAACIAAYREALAAGRPFDLVIMDLTIPGGMGGREAIGALRQIDPLVRAIVSSGYANDPILAHHREFGFVAVVPKPYELTRLTQAIADALAEGADL